MTTPTLSERLPAVTGRLRGVRGAPTFLAAGVAAIGVYFALPDEAQSVFYVAIGFAAVVAVSVGATRHLPRGERIAWQLFALGLLGPVVGAATRAVYEIHLNREPPTPSLGDAFSLAGYPLLAAGIFLSLRRLGGRTSRTAILDALVLFAGIALVQWIFFIDPYNHVHFAGELARVVRMAYPAMDVVLLVALAQLLVASGGRTRANRLLLLSVGLWIVADEIAALDLHRPARGGWIDALWLGSYVAWGAAALEPSLAHLVQPERRRFPRLSHARLVLLAAASLTAPVTLLVERAAHHRQHAYVIALGGAFLATAVLVRLAELVHAVERSGRAERFARREAEQAQQLLAYQNQQLVELDHLKDEFVSSVSHELRTPLTSISGYVELLLETEASEEKRGHLAIIDRNADRLLALVSDLLFAARLQYGRLELERTPVDLRRLVLDAVEAARPRAAAASIELHVDAGESPPFDGEPARLAQLFDNLVSNAIKFTPSGGRVSVSLQDAGQTIRLEVADTGIGIADAEEGRLFERFFRSQSALEAQIQGTGLGLYISKAIVDAHGARIGVESVPGGGTTFVVEFPAAT